MKNNPSISAYALAVLFRSVGRDLARSLPPKEKPAKELPYAWRLALVRASLAYALLAPLEARPNRYLPRTSRDSEKTLRLVKYAPK